MGVRYIDGGYVGIIFRNSLVRTSKGVWLQALLCGLGLRLSLRVQVPNNHILTQNLDYNYS